MKTPSQALQDKIVNQVKDKFEHYKTLLNYQRQKWNELYRATYIFETTRNNPGNSTLFIPKCYEQVEKVAPRIFGNNPKFVIGLNSPINYKDPNADMMRNAQAAQTSLNYFWKVGECQKKSRTWVKAGLVYGVAFAKAEICRKTGSRTETRITADEMGNPTLQETTVEQVIQEYPTFEVLDIFDTYFDPRIENEGDRDGFVINTDDVRLADIINQKDKYFNLKKIQNAGGDQFATDNDSKKLTRWNMHGIPTFYDKDSSKCNIKTYYGYFSESGDVKDEKIIEATIFENDTLISYKEIEFIPIEKFIPTDIPNLGVGLGVVEPIKKIQDAYNLTRNQRIENVSLVLNRMWLMKTGAGIDPRKLRSAAGNVIPVKDINDLQPLQTPDVTGSSYSETQALNTEIQTTLGTIDTSQDNSANGFTNLATGQKIRWNEFNVRFKAMKENFEESLSRIGEKMLRIVGEHATHNPLVQDEVTKQFYEVAKSAFDSAQDFYNISVLADSTAYDSTENNREQALALGQLAIAYKAQGVNVDMNKIFTGILDSFPGVNAQDYLSPEQPPQPQQGGAPNAMPKGTVEQAQVQASPEDQLSQSLTNV